MKHIDFTVYDPTANGIYNGFNGNDDAVNTIISTSIPEWLSREIDIKGRLNHLTYFDYPDIMEQAMPYYVADPINDAWSEEVKEMLRERISKKTASGVCHVPYALAKSLIENVVISEVQAAAPKLANQLAKKIENAKKNGLIFATKKAAATYQKRYNDMNNDGGYGFVPDTYTEAEIAELRERLDLLKSFMREEK